MPISIAEAQAQAISSGFLDSQNEAIGAPVQLGISQKVLAQYGAEFELVLSRIANDRKVVASGDLLTKMRFQVVGDNTLQIILPDYFDYPNEGVKGVKSSANAPGSPYQYKTFGMSKEGRASIANYIATGKAKIETVVRKRDKALGIGRERKSLSLIDVKTNQLVYLIKAYGIKATHYFTDAIKETFKDFELKMSEAVGRDIIFTLEKLNRK